MASDGTVGAESSLFSRSQSSLVLWEGLWPSPLQGWKGRVLFIKSQLGCLSLPACAGSVLSSLDRDISGPTAVPFPLTLGSAPTQVKANIS